MSRVIFALMWLAHFLPLAVLARLGEWVGTVAYWFIPERRMVARVNLARCFPQMPQAERERLARAHFRAFCRSFVEHGLLWWAPRSRIERLVRIEGLEHLHALRGQRVVLLAPHFVGLDAGGTRLACEGDMASMFANQKDPRFGALLRKGRSRFGDQRLISRQEGIRAAIAVIREGRPFYYLPDQDYGARDALFVPFFGVPAATVTALPRLARITGATILPAVTRMLPGGGGYVLTLGPAWSDFPTGDLEADTRRMNAYIEARVLEMPEQYFWMHKRFKTRPAGEARFYSV
ncbi:MAG: lipid A biosynthesis acyltransferase [Betaproteobacteria bacterium]|nr:lipid A biosynthesis acyltransferase [Betaproteobacteria bacterium]